MLEFRVMDWCNAWISSHGLVYETNAFDSWIGVWN